MSWDLAPEAQQLPIVPVVLLHNEGLEMLVVKEPAVWVNSAQEGKTDKRRPRQSEWAFPCLGYQGKSLGEALHSADYNLWQVDIKINHNWKENFANLPNPAYFGVLCFMPLQI